MTNTPPEVLEKWRKEFEAHISKEHVAFSILSKVDDKTKQLFDAMFMVWVAARQTAVIELPKALALDAQFYFVELCRVLREQGYRVEVKGE